MKVAHQDPWANLCVAVFDYTLIRHYAILDGREVCRIMELVIFVLLLGGVTWVWQARDDISELPGFLGAGLLFGGILLGFYAFAWIVGAACLSSA